MLPCILIFLTGKEIITVQNTVLQSLMKLAFALPLAKKSLNFMLMFSVTCRNLTVYEYIASR